MVPGLTAPVKRFRRFTILYKLVAIMAIKHYHLGDLKVVFHLKA